MKTRTILAIVAGALVVGAAVAGVVVSQQNHSANAEGDSCCTMPAPAAHSDS